MPWQLLWNNRQHFWESVVCQALKTTYFYTYFKDEENENREVKWLIHGHPITNCQSQDSNLGLLLSKVHALTYYLIPSPQSSLRAGFSRDQQKQAWGWLRALQPAATHVTNGNFLLQISRHYQYLSSAHILMTEEQTLKLLGATYNLLLIRKERY